MTALREILADPLKLLAVTAAVASIGAAVIVLIHERRAGEVALTEEEWRRIFEPNRDNTNQPPPRPDDEGEALPEDWRDWGSKT